MQVEAIQAWPITIPTYLVHGSEDLCETTEDVRNAREVYHARAIAEYLAGRPK